MNSKIEARATHRFKASADRIYDAWLNPAQARSWMAASLKKSGSRVTSNELRSMRESGANSSSRISATVRKPGIGAPTSS